MVNPHFPSFCANQFLVACNKPRLQLFAPFRSTFRNPIHAAFCFPVTRFLHRRNITTMDNSAARDFGTPTSSGRARAQTVTNPRPNRESLDTPTSTHFRRNHTLSPSVRHSVHSVSRPYLSRLKRSETVVYYHNEAEDDTSVYDRERPGAEPGIDTSKDDTDEHFANLVAESQITLVDFSPEKLERKEMYNDEFCEFMKTPRPDWATCRWINVNGLSWDVIRSIGNHYKLHRLAIEDLIHARGRAKTDWYQTHVYCKHYSLFHHTHTLLECLFRSHVCQFMEFK